MSPDSKNKIAIVAGLLLLLLLGGWGVFWFMDNFEQREREFRSEQSPMARLNPYLAAERYLRRVGFEVESLSGREWLINPPEEPGVLFVHHLGPSLPPEREEALLRWVDQGGRLILVARQLWDEDELTSGNSLLDRLGVQLVESGDSSQDEDDPLQGVDLVQLTLIDQDGEATGPEFNMGFRPNRILDDGDMDASWVLEGDLGPHLMEWSWGRGWITVLSDGTLFSNEKIEKYDNAWFLSYLVEGDQKIWLLYSSNMPTLLELIWRYLPYLLIMLTLLLLLMIWRLTLHSGPRLSVGGGARRNLLEHLQAAANYVWRIDRASDLFNSSRRRVEQHWRRRHPLLDRLDQQARCDWIAEQTGLDSGAIFTALYSQPKDEQALIRISAIQQKLMRHLGRR
ncbi:MAG: DUF4350 domain-containing protein [Gammaproteobacteria bacterium]|nr:DUF4350 domain-containing protein [Gammaproteobacteria bacterium]